MKPEYFSAFAALAGSAVGALTSLASTWLSQSAQARAEHLAHNRTRREELYKDFIEEASQLFADAFEHGEAEFGKFVKLYALIGRMRVLSSPTIVESAESVARNILDTYRMPNKTFRDLGEAVSSDAVDPLRRFGEACHEELQGLGLRGWTPIPGRGRHRMRGTRTAPSTERGRSASG